MSLLPAKSTRSLAFLPGRTPPDLFAAVCQPTLSAAPLLQLIVAEFAECSITNGIAAMRPRRHLKTFELFLFNGNNVICCCVVRFRLSFFTFKEGSY